MKATHLVTLFMISSVSACYRHARPDDPSGAPSAAKTDLVSIPAATITQGDNTGESDEYPERKVRLSSFRMERTEVSNREYQACVNAKACVATPFADDPKLGVKDHPVVGITWDDARTYCEWIGRRLPTEAEWEHAARGTDLRKYPWKGGFDAKYANTRTDEDPHPTTAPVTAYAEGASPYGVLNMAGNVAEWVADFYDPTYYRSESGDVSNPKGPDSGRERSVRGGSYADPSYLVRVSARRGKVPTESDSAIGFRCAGD